MPVLVPVQGEREGEGASAEMGRPFNLSHVAPQKVNSTPILALFSRRSLPLSSRRRLRDRLKVASLTLPDFRPASPQAVKLDYSLPQPRALRLSLVPVQVAQRVARNRIAPSVDPPLQAHYRPLAQPTRAPRLGSFAPASDKRNIAGNSRRKLSGCWLSPPLLCPLRPRHSPAFPSRFDIFSCRIQVPHPDVSST